MPTPTSLIERLRYYAENSPNHHAVVTPDFRLSYLQLFQVIKAQAKVLEDTGITHEAVIGIKCPNDVEHLVICLAAIYMGATSCTIPSFDTLEAQDNAAQRCGATHIIDTSIINRYLSQQDGTLPSIDSSPHDEAQLLFATSGTTGEPKLVIHQDNDLVAQAHRHIESSQQRFACLASMEHNFAKRHRLYCVAMGATNAFLDNNPKTLVPTCLALKVNVLHVSAFQAQELLAIPEINLLGTLRLKLGGSHVPITLRKQLKEKITSNLQAGYGTTETGAIGFTDPTDTDADESVGHPLSGIEVRVFSPTNKALGANQRGELAIRCEGMFRGYLNKPDLTSARLRDGWFYTGDIGYLDDQQRIHLCGRSDDMFVFNSMNIYPQDIESQICQHPDIAEAAVVPKASAVHGDIPVALVVAEAGTTPDLAGIKKFTKKRVGIRCPRQFIIVETLPRNTSGKISRSQAISISAGIDEIRRSIIQSFESDKISHLKSTLITAFEKGDKDIPLRKLAMDSLTRMDLLVAMETQHNAVITPQAFAHCNSLEDIVSLVLAASQDTPPATLAPQICTSQTIPTHKLPYIARLFRRAFGFCHTVAQLNRVLSTFEHRLTPADVHCLYEQHTMGQLLPPNTEQKYQTALSHWLDSITKMMADSGKSHTERFSSRKLTPSVRYFASPGSQHKKTLLVCFSPSGGHSLMMPNAVLMQHTDAQHYDLLVICEPQNEGYRLGIPFLGDDVITAIKQLAQLPVISLYPTIRTLGCSAGGFAAVIAGYLLNAEMAVCVGGRFYADLRIIKNLGRLRATRQAVRQGTCPHVLMSYATDKTRDYRYARRIGRICDGHLIGVEFANGEVGHLILERLVERGELADYLARTLFIATDNPLLTRKASKTVIRFPVTG